MSLNAKDYKGSGGGAPAMEPGAYPARLVVIAGLGLQEQRPYKGETKPPQYELQLVYECTDEFLKDEDGNDREDKPRWLWENFPIHSLDSERAKSTKRYYAIDPKEEQGGDWAKLIATPVMVTITKDEGSGKNKGRTYNNVASVSTMREKEAAKAPDLVNQPLVFDFDNPDIEVFKLLPESVQNKIKGSLDYDGSELMLLLDSEGDTEENQKQEDVSEEEKDW